MNRSEICSKEVNSTDSDKKTPFDPNVDDDALVQMFDDIILSKLNSEEAETSNPSLGSIQHFAMTEPHLHLSMEALDSETQFLLSYCMLKKHTIIHHLSNGSQSPIILHLPW